MTIDAETFDRDYEPLTAPSGDDVWTFTEVRGYNLPYVWTIVDGEDGAMYAVPGFHIVNRVGYVVTRRPWRDEMIDAVWYAPSDYD